MRQRWRSWPRWVRWPLLAGGGLFFLGVLFLAFLWFTVDLPDDPPELQSAVLVDKDGKELAVLSQEGERFVVSLDQVNPVVIDALLSSEDRRFYEHGGIDPVGISRALMSNIRTSRTQGGSTITQQLVKNEYLSSERTFMRKAREAVLSVKLERSEDKDEILERYLNTVYFGRGAYGIEAAARQYFNVHAADLDAGQAALLVGLLRSPESADPVEDMKAATQRRANVVHEMVENDKLSQKEADYILAAPIQATDKTAPTPPTAGLAPHFVEWVRQQVVKELGEDALYGRGLRIVTTLDMKAQKAAEAAVAETITDPKGPQAALIALDEDGAIRAHVGSRDYDTLKVDLARGVDGGGSGRQPGSTFKPFVLDAALQDGVTLGDRYDGPSQIEVDVDGQPFKAKNYGLERFGNLSVADATKNSVNTVYAQLVAKVGPKAVAEAAHAAGIDADLDEVPAIALGVEEVSPLDLASAYLTFADDGTKVEPYAIERVEDQDGNVIWKPERPKPQAKAVDPDVARAVTEALRGVIESGTGTAADIGRPAAGKTGTTQENVDAWFAGYVPGYTAVVWMGYPDPTPVPGMTGGKLPARIWQRYMSVAMEGREVQDFPKPPDDLVRQKQAPLPPKPSTSSTSSTLPPSTTTTKPKKGNGKGATTTTTSTTEPPTTSTSAAGQTDAGAGQPP
ncbi:MAG: transglycosylase domain-containing protein [Acidimicrobiales bacterium]